MLLLEGLDEYRRKRDFERTHEPRGRVARKRDGTLEYVIQKHAARNLHYDFRLELDGVLESWAVPKGPSLVPNERDDEGVGTAGRSPMRPTRRRTGQLQIDADRGPGGKPMTE